MVCIARNIEVEITLKLKGTQAISSYISKTFNKNFDLSTLLKL